MLDNPWARKTDDELEAAAAELATYTPEGQDLIIAEMRRRLREPRSSIVPPPIVPQREQEPIDQRLVGIRGWLILPAVGTPLGLVVSVVSLQIWFESSSAAAKAGYGSLHNLAIFADICFLFLGIYALVVFFGKRQNAPSYFIGLMIAKLVVSGHFLAYAAGAGADPYIGNYLVTLLGSLGGAAIWIPYFRTSKRVKATFVR